MVYIRLFHQRKDLGCSLLNEVQQVLHSVNKVQAITG
ncbi:Uncharacterised protein [Vibrio cholerae]|nr:Uncharacterised protein [Vibrio cholerae]